jgi:hypothetical protein
MVTMAAASGHQRMPRYAMIPLSITCGYRSIFPKKTTEKRLQSAENEIMSDVTGAA